MDTFKRKIFKIIQKSIAKHGFVLTHSLNMLGRERLINTLTRGDYIRISSLEAIASEIYDKKIDGNVAELGVYQGDFAYFINLVFNDRKLYLFDTFDGFDIRDLKIEQTNNYSSNHVQDFSETNEKKVLNKMPYPNLCIIKKGYFPDTAYELKDEFSFVSIDTDLFEPIYQGLHFFYPRLVKGGYIFVHDYNNMNYSGAKAAVRRYCNEHNIAYFPLSDGGGTAVILK